MISTIIIVLRLVALFIIWPSILDDDINQVGPGEKLGMSLDTSDTLVALVSINLAFHDLTLMPLLSKNLTCHQPLEFWFGLVALVSKSMICFE